MKLEDLTNRLISIQVNEPWEWKYGIITDRITDNRTDRLIITLTKSIKGNKFRSNKLTVSARYEREAFMTLVEKRNLTVGGALIKEDSGEADNILIGTLKL